MSRRTGARRIDRETSGAIDFDAALADYVAGGDIGGTVLRAAGHSVDALEPYFHAV
jgi:hypothetical protein